jgi:hypothetical protein
MLESLSKVNLTKGIYSSYINLCCDFYLCQSCKHQYFRRKKSREFHAKFKIYFELLNDNIEDFQSIIDLQILINQAIKFPYLYDNDDKVLIDFLNEFNLNNDFILKDLNLSYKRLWNSIPTAELNLKYLKLCRYRFNYISLDKLIEFFLHSIISDKEFDVVRILEPMLFLDQQLNCALISSQLDIYLNFIICLTYLEDIDGVSKKLKILYEYCDANLSLKGNKFQNDTLKWKYFFDSGIKTLVLKDREKFENLILSKNTNWRFIDNVQLENAYRLNLVDEKKYLKYKAIFDQRNNNILLNRNIFHDSVDKTGFLDLLIDKEIILSNYYYNEIEYPRNSDLNVLNNRYLINYKFIFDGPLFDIDDITEYLQIRILRLFQEFNLFNEKSDSIINELIMYKGISPKYIIEEINFTVSEINSYLELKMKGILEKVIVLKTKLKETHQGICVKIGDQIERFYFRLDFKDALNIDYKIIDYAADYGSNASYDEYVDANITFRIFRLMYEFNWLPEVEESKKIKINDLKNINNCHKVISLLEKPCTIFLKQYNDELPTEILIPFYHNVFCILIKAFIKSNQMDKAQKWSVKYVNLMEDNPTIARNSTHIRFLNKLKQDFFR